MGWTTPEDIKAQMQRHWDQGRILVARLTGASLFPLRLRLSRPDARALSTRFDEVRGWIRSLEEGSKAAHGFGYEVQWAEINHRQIGRNRVPDAIVVPTEPDALAFIGKRRQADRFQALADATLTACPRLRDWLSRKPLTALEHADDWERIVAILLSLQDRPRPALYIRQLDVPGVDTKFVEGRKGLLAELLDEVLPPEAIDHDAEGARRFEQRYGFLSKPAPVRFRLLDPRIRVGGLCDIATPASELAQLRLPVNRVFLTENEINGLTFPDVEESLVIFGLGYGLDRLGEIAWLADKTVHYWGDIDTHGFAILDRLRTAFPNVCSFLMDRKTLIAHRTAWVREGEPHEAPLGRLTRTERALYEDLVHNRLGERVRLEQERVSFASVKHALREALLQGTGAQDE